ncbi:MAG: D-2-hydroxyacid dehydrogenase [Treponema sp.]|jgi:phosphoglycerate dehydrogenase-like enzyme|nr:D-2-hydroxyacid dehydrogenase [Treponema sp.]
MENNIILLSLHSFRLMPEFRERLEIAGDGREVLISVESAEIEPFLDRIEIGMGDIPFTLIPRMPCFRWWQLWSAGADILQRFPALKELPFQLSTTSGIHGQQIAEHLFAMLLGWNRCIPQAINAQRRHEWLFVKDPQLDVLNGKTMLIIGYGVIGKVVARIAVSFGLKVIGLRRSPAAGMETDVTTIVPVTELRNYLPQADYVVNILPSTGDTLRFFNAAEFNLMKNSALYVNIGRGATTNDEALINALREKRIKGALLDVTETEPLTPDSPLWDMDNVILTGHYAGCHPDYSRLAMSVALENLERYKRGEPLKNLVDKSKGY